eukprot:CAMPEP_0119057660 /NCGR_PEP_ID=MMETSP1178-20130426/2082_1 /TAXON_ID=33656 /ORGANISM="unid sp, Strain CCMP2000" /LENGTH=155 /DNA_ID=CAMNT_0007038515 /DNA_START=397 /DNA_END=864 /DNA_ORIENTATION=-
MRHVPVDVFIVAQHEARLIDGTSPRHVPEQHMKAEALMNGLLRLLGHGAVGSEKVVYQRDAVFDQHLVKLVQDRWQLRMCVHERLLRDDVGEAAVQAGWHVSETPNKKIKIQIRVLPGQLFGSRNIALAQIKPSAGRTCQLCNELASEAFAATKI